MTLTEEEYEDDQRGREAELTAMAVGARSLKPLSRAPSTIIFLTCKEEGLLVNTPSEREESLEAYLCCVQMLTRKKE